MEFVDRSDEGYKSSNFQPQSDESVKIAPNMSGFTDRSDMQQTPALEGEAEPQKLNKSDFKRGMLSMLAQGATLGTSDEISAAIQSFPSLFSDEESFGDSYKRIVTEARDEQEQFRKEYPKESMGAELAGGFATGGIGGLRVAGRLAGAPKVVKYAAAGAVPGAIAGAGYSDQDPNQPIADIATETAMDVLKGAGQGAAFGVGVPLIAKGVGKAYGASTDVFRGQESKALRKISEAFGKDNISPTQARRRMASLGPNASVGDIGGDNVMGLSQAVIQQPGRAMNKGNKFYFKRQKGQRGRVKENIENEISGEDFNDKKDAIFRQRGEEAGPLYKAAYETEIKDTPMFRALKDNDIVKRAMKEAVQNIKDDMNLPDNIKNIDIDNPNTLLWDYTKKAVDDMEEKLINPMVKGGGNKARIYGNVRRMISDEIDKQNPAYKAARNVWEDSAKNLDAMDKGRNIFRSSSKDSSLSKKQFNRMSSTEKDLYRLGAADELVRVIRNTKDTLEGVSPALYPKIFGSENQREAIEVMFGSNKKFKKFAREMERERVFNNNKNKVTGNSSTAKNQALQAELSVDTSAIADVGGATTGNLWAVSRLIKRMTAATRDSRLDKELADRLFTSDTNEIKDTLLEIEKKGNLLPSWAKKIETMGPQQFVRWVSPERNSDKLMSFIAGASGTL